uniref:Succinyl-CoA:3-ketoacid coenzyme A transferase 2A, mitochondrial-like n=1 Tax=Crassostrea virginica TaxID=6565 RepID=A0A8B8CM44_CRAVI|nr:succinyl-CoA:3-ketoacid coenzyme A transferase 2A, mitochondrial-like [Crassostrea virginica]
MCNPRTYQPYDSRSFTSFTLRRSGYLDDPWSLGEGDGRAMDLVSSHKIKVIVNMEHQDKKGNSKIVDNCNLPLTGKSCVDMIITDKCFFEVDKEKGLVPTEIAENEDIPSIFGATNCEFVIRTNTDHNDI